MPNDVSRASRVLTAQQHLERNLRAFTEAYRSGDVAAADRFIDRVGRVAAEDPDIAYLRGKLLLETGKPNSAIQCLQLASRQRNSPDAVALLIKSFLLVGWQVQAKALLEEALGDYAVLPGSSLASTADELTAIIGENGWIGRAPDLHLTGRVKIPDGRQAASVTVIRGRTVRVVELAGRPGAWVDANLPMVGDRDPTRVSVGGLTLLGGWLDRSRLNFRESGDCRIDDDGMSGWVAFGWNPQCSPEVLVAGAGQSIRCATEPDRLVRGRHAFSIPMEQLQPLGNRLQISVRLPTGAWSELPISPVLIDPGPPLPPKPSKPSGKAGSAVDIVIPVYRGLDETLACIRSVLKTAGKLGRIIVIDDASPEPALSAALDDFSARGEIILVRNRRNLGFPRSVNRGMLYSRDRDVVILNSDVEVYPGWLERLRAAALGDARTGTVTPLTNAGTIASYPPSEDPDCDRRRARSLNRIAARLNHRQTAEIPTGVGFCMYIRRDCIREIGLLDSATFGKGYGEENDFCLRASAAGWRHHLALDVYVRHIGGKSFGSRKAGLSSRALRLLNLRYPGYDAMIQAHIADDPALPARRRIDEYRLRKLPVRKALVVTLALEGGVRRAVNERVAALQDQSVQPIVLKPDPDKPDRCRLEVPGHVFEDLVYRFDSETEDLIEFLTTLQIEATQLHHFLGLPGPLIDGIYLLDAPVTVHIHDYIWYCPRITMLTESSTYCGEPELTGCEACIRENGSPMSERISVDALRRRSARWLRAAADVVVPSRTVLQRYARRFPETVFRVEPLEPDSAYGPTHALPTGSSLKIALIGGIGPQKGYDLLLAAASDARNRDLPIEFVVIGYTKDDEEVLSTGKVFVTGRYEEAELPDLIEREAPDLAMFLSVFPETWCYALTHALRAGLPIVALDHGAIGERVRDAKVPAILLSPSVAASELNDAILEQLGQWRKKSETDSASHSALALPAPITSTQNQPAVISRNSMAPRFPGLTANVEVLPLVRGLYQISVISGSPERIGDEQEITVPAIQLGVGPGVPDGSVEFLYGPRTEGTWLSQPRDMLIMKVKSASTLITMTTMRLAHQAPLEVEMKRLDGTNPTPRSEEQRQPAQEARPQAMLPSALAPQPARPPAVSAPIGNPTVPPPAWYRSKSLPLTVVTHVQNRGDINSSEAQWAGAPGQGLSIEAIQILPVEGYSSDAIEYKTVAVSGAESHWVTGGAPSGSRGMGLPLAGFAVRVNPQSSAGLACEYGAMMVSGSTIGPFRDGATCRSPDPRDPIGAVWISVYEAAQPDEAVMAGEQPEQVVAPSRKRAAQGPRFSIFREAAEP